MPDECQTRPWYEHLLMATAWMILVNLAAVSASMLYLLARAVWRLRAFADDLDPEP